MKVIELKPDFVSSPEVGTERQEYQCLTPRLETGRSSWTAFVEASSLGKESIQDKLQMLGRKYKCGGSEG